MSVDAVFSPGAIFIDDDAASSEVGLAGLGSYGVTTGNEARTIRGAGGLYETSAHIHKQAPGFSFATSQINTALSLTAGGVRCIKSVGASKYGMDAYLAKHDCDGRSVSDNQQYRFANGLLVPRTLELTHGEIASMALELKPTGDESNHPMTSTAGVVIPAGAVANEAYTLYRATVAGAVLKGVKSTQLEFGLTVTEEMADNDLWPTWASVATYATRITLSGLNPRWLSDTVIPIGGKKLELANTRFDAVRYVDTDAGSFMPLNENHHITIGTYGLGFITTAASGSGDASLTSTELQIICLYDGSNAPLTINRTASLE